MATNKSGATLRSINAPIFTRWAPRFIIAPQASRRFQDLHLAIIMNKHLAPDPAPNPAGWRRELSDPAAYFIMRLMHKIRLSFYRCAGGGGSRATNSRGGSGAGGGRQGRNSLGGIHDFLVCETDCKGNRGCGAVGRRRFWDWEWAPWSERTEPQNSENRTQPSFLTNPYRHPMTRAPTHRLRLRLFRFRSPETPTAPPPVPPPVSIQPAAPNLTLVTYTWCNPSVT